MDELANHHDLESCGAVGNYCGEAFASAYAGRALGFDRPIGGAAPLNRWGRQLCQVRHRDPVLDLPGSENPCMHGRAPGEKRKIPHHPRSFLPRFGS